MAYGNTGFKEGSTDVFNRYVSKEYLMEYYPDLLPSKIAPRLWTWGYNEFFELGDGTTTNRSSPGTVYVSSGSATIWKQVAFGLLVTAAVKTDGTLWTWGNSAKGRLGNGSSIGDISYPQTTAGGGTNWKQVSVCGETPAAIKTDGTLWTWGYNLYGQLGDGTTNTSKNSPGTTAGGGTNWKQVSSGDTATAAVKTDGTLWTWGYNRYGELGTGTTTSRNSPGTTAGGGNDWKQVSVGPNNAAAIKTDGTLWTWGHNNLQTFLGQLGDGTTTNKSSPVTTAGGGTNWKQVSVGGTFTAAVKTDGTLWTWGQNGFGQLGTGTTVSRSSPGTTAGGGTSWKQVVAGDWNAAAVKTDGTLWTWGDNYYGALGDGTTTSRSSPGTTAGGGTNWKRVADNLETSSLTSMGAINESGNW